MLQLNENYSNSTPIAVLGTVQSSEMDYITSLQISELTGKQHAHIMRDIRNLLEQGMPNPILDWAHTQMLTTNKGLVII